MFSRRLGHILKEDTERVLGLLPDDTGCSITPRCAILDDCQMAFTIVQEDLGQCGREVLALCRFNARPNFSLAVTRGRILELATRDMGKSERLESLAFSGEGHTWLAMKEPVWRVPTVLCKPTAISFGPAAALSWAVCPETGDSWDMGLRQLNRVTLLMSKVTD